MDKEPQKRKVTVTETVKVMYGFGADISEKDAEIILEFLYFLGKLTVNQVINDLENENIKPL